MISCSGKIKKIRRATKWSSRVGVILNRATSVIIEKVRIEQRIEEVRELAS